MKDTSALEKAEDEEEEEEGEQQQQATALTQTHFKTNGLNAAALCSNAGWKTMFCKL